VTQLPGHVAATVGQSESEGKAHGNRQHQLVARPPPGRTVALVSTEVSSEDPLTAVAAVRVDGGAVLTPSVAVYPERSLRLPEVSTRTTPWLDTQAVLRDVHPTEGALITMLFRPWNQLVWWGVGFIAAATGLLLGVSRPLQADNQRTANPGGGRRS